MIACGPCNDKIYARCLGMIRDCCKGGSCSLFVFFFFFNMLESIVSLREAEIAMLKAIYRVDSVDFDQMMRIPRVEHIRASVPAEDQRHEPQICLPVAFLCALGWRVEDACRAVLAQPQLNVLLKEEFAKKQRHSGSGLTALALGELEHVLFCVC